jgi:hypothetical protein
VRKLRCRASSRDVSITIRVGVLAAISRARAKRSSRVIGVSLADGPAQGKGRRPKPAPPQPSACPLLGRPHGNLLAHSPSACEICHTRTKKPRKAVLSTRASSFLTRLAGGGCVRGACLPIKLAHFGQVPHCPEAALDYSLRVSSSLLWPGAYAEAPGPVSFCIW